MHIILDDRVEEPIYQVGDVISTKNGTYIIYKTPNEPEYHLVTTTFKSWGNGRWVNIIDMIDDLKRNGAIKHYSRDDYDLKLVKRK
ncbi:hypothetical protein CHOTACABRAS_155 [Bacillus phage Chotacabras]|nr:hypothetical protein CHOTACABRAS_155 [Bacillus phage Chotacabras]